MIPSDGEARGRFQRIEEDGCKVECGRAKSPRYPFFYFGDEYRFSMVFSKPLSNFEGRSKMNMFKRTRWWRLPSAWRLPLSVQSRLPASRSLFSSRCRGDLSVLRSMMNQMKAEAAKLGGHQGSSKAVSGFFAEANRRCRGGDRAEGQRHS